MTELEYARGGFVTDGTFNGEQVTLDPRLLRILAVTAERFPLNVVAFSGVAGRNTGTLNHPAGNAIDVLIFNEEGLPIPNFNYGPSFEIYENFAWTARDVQQELYPELDQLFRWGGYFVSGGADLMHFDISGGGTAGGDWESGLNDARRAQIQAMTDGNIRYTDGREGTVVFPPDAAGFADVRDYFGFARDFYQQFGGSPTFVMQAQRSLRDLGYYEGPIDGVFGPSTNAATAQFAVEFQIPLPTPRPEFVGPVTAEYPAPWTSRFGGLGTVANGLPPEQAPPILQPNPLRADPPIPPLPQPRPPTIERPIPQSAGVASPWLAIAGGAFGQPQASGLAALALGTPAFGSTTVPGRRGLLDVEAIEAEEARVAALSTGPGPNSFAKATGVRPPAVAPAVDPNQPLETDPVDVWIAKRNAQTRPPTVEDTRRLAAMPLTDDLSTEEWLKRRNAQVRFSRMA